MLSELKTDDFVKVEVDPRGENILAPNGNHHPPTRSKPRLVRFGDMKVVTIWQKSGTIALVRDSIGDLYTPKSELPAPGNFDLHIPTREKLDVTDIPLPAGVSYFIDSLEDDLEETSNKLKNLLQGAIENRLLIVRLSDPACLAEVR